MPVTSQNSIPIKDLRDYIARDFYKVRNYRIFPLYFVYLVLLLGLLLWNRSHNNSKDASFYPLQNVKEMYGESTFMELYEAPQFYDWLETTIRTAYATRGASDDGFSSTMEPLGFMLLRQQRFGVRPCEDPAVHYATYISEYFKEMNMTCVNRDQWATDPFGNPADPWRSNMLIPEDYTPDARAVSGQLYSFTSDPAQQYSTKFFYDEDLPPSVAAPPTEVINNLEKALAELDRMRNWSWIESLTGIISVDMIFFTPPDQSLTRVTFIAEQATSGLLMPRVDGNVFNLRNLGEFRANFAFFVDFLMLLCAGALTLEWLLLIKVNLALTKSLRASLLGFWELISLPLIVLLWIVFVFRMQLWSFSNDNSDANKYLGMDHDRSATTMFNGISWASHKFETSYVLLSVVLILYTLKLLMYVQYVAGINLVSQTINRSMADIVGVGGITIVLLVTFSTAGNVFFGSFSSDFATFGKSFATLTRLVVSAEVEMFDELSARAPRVTAIYFTCFYFLLVIISVNLVLGIILNSFAESKVESLNKLKHKEFESFGTVLQRYILMKGQEYKDEPYLAAKYAGRTMSTSVAACSAALRTQISFGGRMQRLSHAYNERFLAVIELDRIAGRGETVIYRDDLDRMLPMMAPNQRELMFDIVYSRNKARAQSRSDEIANDNEVAEFLTRIQATVRHANAIVTKTELSPEELKMAEIAESDTEDDDEDEEFDAVIELNSIANDNFTKGLDASIATTINMFNKRRAGGIVISRQRGRDPKVGGFNTGALRESKGQSTGFHIQ